MNCTLVVPHTVLDCVTSPGAGRQLQFQVRCGCCDLCSSISISLSRQVIVDGLNSSAPESQCVHAWVRWSTCVNRIVARRYEAPQIISISDAPLTARGVVGWSTLGGQRITISGRNFGGLPEYIDQMWYGVSQQYVLPLSRRAGEPGCTLAVPHVAIVCTTLPGVGAGHGWFVNVLDQVSNPSPVPFSYMAPNVTGAVYVEDAIAGVHAVATTGGTIRLVGFDFGRRSDGLELRVALGPAKVSAPVLYLACADGVGITVDYCVEFAVPAGDGIVREMQLAVGGQLSQPVWFSYADPRIRDMVVTQVRIPVVQCWRVRWW